MQLEEGGRWAESGTGLAERGHAPLAARWWRELSLRVSLVSAGCYGKMWSPLVVLAGLLALGTLAHVQSRARPGRGRGSNWW